MVVCQVTREFQVTIPEAIREELQFAEGTHLIVGVGELIRDLYDDEDLPDTPHTRSAVRA